MIEELSQDQDSFKHYTNATKHYIKIKRGDSLIRNRGNIEIDIKCRSFRNGTFRFRKEDAYKHCQMQKFTNSPVLIGVYQRDKDTIKDPIPYFFDVSQLWNNGFKEVYVKEENTGNCFEVPLEFTYKGFDFINSYNCNSGHFEYWDKSNAGEPWRSEDVESLKYMLKD